LHDPPLTADELCLRCETHDERAWHGARANVGVASGQYYFEVEVLRAGICRLGWAADDSALDLGTDLFGYGYGGTGKRANANSFSEYGGPYGAGDVIGCSLNRSAGTVAYARNGEDLGVAFRLNGKGGAHPPLHPACVLKNATVRFNFGGAPFRHRCCAAAGFSALHVACGGAGGGRGKKGGGKLPPRRPNDLVFSEGSGGVGGVGGGGGGGGGCTPAAVVIEPTRELAQQTFDCFAALAAHLRVPGAGRMRCQLAIGGWDGGKGGSGKGGSGKGGGGGGAGGGQGQLGSGCDVLVCTPGRLAAALQSGGGGGGGKSGGGKLQLGRCRFIVLDEVRLL
jgi:ATP-dependent RNA helicase DDX1